MQTQLTAGLGIGEAPAGAAPSDPPRGLPPTPCAAVDPPTGLPISPFAAVDPPSGLPPSPFAVLDPPPGLPRTRFGGSALSSECAEDASSTTPAAGLAVPANPTGGRRDGLRNETKLKRGSQWPCRVFSAVCAMAGKNIVCKELSMFGRVDKDLLRKVPLRCRNMPHIWTAWDRYKLVGPNLLL
jgi:hypothetical protein